MCACNFTVLQYLRFIVENRSIIEFHDISVSWKLFDSSTQGTKKSAAKIVPVPNKYAHLVKHGKYTHINLKRTVPLKQTLVNLKSVLR